MFGNIPINIQILYKILNIPINIHILYKILNKKGNREARLAHLISGLCPESISEHPGLDFSSWPSAAGIIRFFPNYFRKSRPPIGPLEFCPGAKSYFR